MIDQQSIKLLVIEDDEDDYFLLTVTLDEIPLKKEITWAPNFTKAKDFLNSRDFDICIVDYRLGAQTGIDVIKYIKTVNSYLPTILLTGLKENTIDEEALRSGAYDYLVKGQFNADSLGRSIRYSIERAKSIRSLKESEYKFRNLFENAIANTFIIKSDGAIADVNRMARESLEIESSDQLIHKHISDFVPLFAKVNFHSSNLLEYLTSINHSEVDFLSAKGKKICTLYLSPVDSFRQLLQVSLIDITEQKAQKEKEKILEKQALTGKVAMVIAHEIKNPLTNINLSISEIKLILQNIKVENPDDDPAEFLTIIEKNSERINNLLNDLLNATRYDFINSEEIKFGDVVGEVLQLSEDRIKLKGIKLNTKIDEDAQITADKEKLVIALLNILVNAVEAVEEKTGEIVLKTQKDDKSIHLLIQDNGPGINEENMKRLFEPFFTSKKGGTGLGLAAAYNIISKHDGSIKVESNENSGTAFTISLPVC